MIADLVCFLCGKKTAQQDMRLAAGDKANALGPAKNPCQILHNFSSL